jgi:hypothetical protein
MQSFSICTEFYSLLFWFCIYIFSNVLFSSFGFIFSQNFTYSLYYFLQTLLFKAMLLVRSFTSLVRQPQEFSITSDPSIPMIDLAKDDVLFNSVTVKNQLCKSSNDMPWRGPKEKSEQLMKIFIHGLSPEEGIVADMTASTGTRNFKVFYFSFCHFILCFCYCSI